MSETLSIEFLPPTGQPDFSQRQARAASEIQNIQSDVMVLDVNLSHPLPGSIREKLEALNIPVIVTREWDAVSEYTQGRRAEALNYAFITQWAYNTSVAIDRHTQPTYRGRLTGPVRALLSIFDRWQISDKDAAVFLGCETTQFINDLRVGTSGLNTRDIKDRSRLLIEIYDAAHSLLRDPTAERSWINAPLEGLKGQTVLEIMRRGSIADLMHAKAFVDHMNGR